MSKPTGSRFPHECSQCKFYQLAIERGLFEKKYRTWCVKFDFQVSEHKDACRSFHEDAPGPTFRCCYCGELIYTAMQTHCDTCPAYAEKMKGMNAIVNANLLRRLS